jgi:hypothetical protein
MGVRNLSHGIASLTAFTTNEARESSVAGRWTGSRQIGEGEIHADRLVLLEDANGVLFGDWRGMIVTGQRLDEETMEFRGRDCTMAYTGRGRLVEGSLCLSFFVITSLGRRIEGTSVLCRAS